MTLKIDDSSFTSHPMRLAVVQALSGLFFLANIIPIIGPIFLGFMLGASAPRYEKKYDTTTKDQFLAMIIGPSLLYGFVALCMTETTILFWLILLGAITINFGFARIAFWIGVKKYAKNNNDG